MGRYRIKITGKSLKYFFDFIIRKKINIYYLEQHKDYIIMVVDYEDYKIIKKIKTTNKIIVLNRYGTLKIVYILEKYKYVLLSFFVTILMLIFLSNVIFDVQVIHTKEDIRDIIYNDLEKFGIKKYNLVKNYSSKEKIKNKILSLEKDKIEWLEIERVGTKYVINVEERKKNKKEDDSNVQDIIAKKDALITNIDASYGEIVKKNNDYVKKGDTIISGVIKNKDKAVTKVRARGKVYGEVWYKVTLHIPRHYYEEKYTGKKKNVFSIKFFKDSYSFFDYKKYKNFKTIENIILSNNYMPIKFSFDTQKEIEVIDKYYDLKNCDQVAFRLGRDSLIRKIGNDSSIISKKILKKSIKDSKIIVEVFFKVEEDITDSKDISDLNLDDINNAEE